MPCFVNNDKKAIPIRLIEADGFVNWLSKQKTSIKSWMNTTQFVPEVRNISLIAEKGKLQEVICIVTDKNNFWDIAHLPFALPPGTYQFFPFKNQYALGWGLGAYQFTRYRAAKREPAVLYLPPSCDKTGVMNQVHGIYLVRDWINIPTEEMGPTELEHEARKLAKTYQARFKTIVGDALLKEGYGCIHAVGRASNDKPRLLDLKWGKKNHPKVTLVGKGVCFDSGGLDIKSSPYMLLMKKDMAGAAHVFGLAKMIMNAKLPVSLRVLVPAVENVISGNAYRPGDVIRTKKGITVEIGNTDAEGRLVLADALSTAIMDQPDIIIDIATLTGAARVALGTDLPAVFCNQDSLVNDVITAGLTVYDPMWRLPLYTPYRENLVSYIADINNNSIDPYGGAISAALFLREFVPDTIPWLHFDLMAWNLRAKPGRPIGGEAFAIRALFHYLRARYS